MTPDEEKQAQRVMIDSLLHPKEDITAHDPEDCQTLCVICDLKPCALGQGCEECGVCLCDLGDHRIECSDYVH